MKIENSGFNRLNRTETESASPADRVNHTNDPATSANSLSGKDRATLSERSRELAKARSTLEETSDVRSEKVEELHDKVQNGTYQVPQEEIVKRLLAQVRLRQDE
jgi:negative regulator of flagellin synthesis FlgM